MDKRPIGIFDSGIGGLTVLNELRKALPQEDFIYFADTKNLPYGSKTPEQIIGFSNNIIRFLQDDMNSKLVIAACNTSSAIAIDQIATNFNIPIIGTIHPIINNILNNNHYKKMGIIATEAAANSKYHENILIKHGFQGEIFSIKCPEFTPLIEEYPINYDKITIYAKKYLKIFDEQRLDSLIYGCTHYPFISNIIENILPKSMQYINPAIDITITTRDYLSSNNLLNNNSNNGDIAFYCSSAPEIFKAKIIALTKIDNPKVKLQSLNCD
jgi:glutamate racemase